MYLQNKPDTRNPTRKETGGSEPCGSPGVIMDSGRNRKNTVRIYYAEWTEIDLQEFAD